MSNKEIVALMNESLLGAFYDRGVIADPKTNDDTQQRIIQMAKTADLYKLCLTKNSSSAAIGHDDSKVFGLVSECRTTSDEEGFKIAGFNDAVMVQINAELRKTFGDLLHIETSGEPDALAIHFSVNEKSIIADYAAQIGFASRVANIIAVATAKGTETQLELLRIADLPGGYIDDADRRIRVGINGVGGHHCS
ncbi:MAG: hypothetical protein EBR02_10005 [Alphaproteobacteria bacterium]|nr:hypothetical protein [Alphaproteobacteria bacterium]